MTSPKTDPVKELVDARRGLVSTQNDYREGRIGHTAVNEAQARLDAAFAALDAEYPEEKPKPAKADDDADLHKSAKHR